MAKYNRHRIGKNTMVWCVQLQEFLLVSPHMPELKLDGRDGFNAHTRC